MKKIFLTGVLLSLASALSFVKAQSIPTNNPYREMYGSRPGFPTAPYHWTDSIRWDNVVNIKDYQNLIVNVTLSNNDRRSNWLPAYNAARDAAAAAGGGVVYFPPLPKRTSENYFDEDSSYYFTDNIFLKSNVVIRGAKPQVSNAKDRKFAPPSFIEFPKYIYVSALTNGTPNSTAFKEITVDTGSTSSFGKKFFINTGVVYLDINRGRIAAHPTFVTVTPPGSSTSTNWGKEPSRNFIVFGTRSNNVAIPDPGVPTPNMNSWLRFPWRFAANIDVFVASNGLICNNRINDYANNDIRKIDEDAFTMLNYNPQGSCGTPNQTFDYNAHYGIILNRLKKSGYSTVLGFISNSTPELEPALFAKGNAVNDNWVYKTSRVGIHAAGLGLDIRRNVLKDNPSKSTLLSPGGATCNTNAQATYENRGIDIAGWNIIVDSNDIEFYRTRLPSVADSAFSADGEGWYSQGPSGSTMRNYRITNNTVRTRYSGLCNTLTTASAQGKGFNGFYNTKDVSNIVVENNNFGGSPFRINANTTGTPGALVRIFVRNNTNVHSAEILGNACGDSVYFNNNTSSCAPCNGITPLNINQFVCLNSNSAQCSSNSNGPVPCLGAATATGANCGGNATMCGLPLAQNFPKVNMITPVSAETVTTPGQSVLLEAIYSLEFCDPDSVRFFKNGNRLPGNVSLNTTDKKASYSSYNAPLSVDFDVITARVCKANDQGNVVCVESNSKIIRVLTEVNTVFQSSQLNIFPNPANQSFTLEISNSKQAELQVELFDLSGKRHLSQNISKFSEKLSKEIEISSLPNGVYLVQVNAGKEKIVRKLVKSN